MTNETKDLTIEERLERMEDFAAVNRALFEYTQRRFMQIPHNEIRDTLLENVTVHQEKWGTEWMVEAAKRMTKESP